MFLKGVLFLFQTLVIDIVYPLEDLVDGLLPALDKFCLQAEQGILNGHSFILLTDRKSGPNFVPVRYIYNSSMFMDLDDLSKNLRFDLLNNPQNIVSFLLREQLSLLPR